MELSRSNASKVSYNPLQDATDRMLELTACRVDIAARRVFRDGTTLSLTTREAELLDHLARRPHTVVSRQELLEQVFGFHPNTTSRAADAAILRLRKKVERDPTDPDHIQAIFGVGYRFVPAGARAPADEAPASHLPRPSGPFFGRAELLERIDGLLRSGVLLTLHGPPGSGKTRLAIEAGTRSSGTVARFVSLAAATSEAEALELIRQGLGEARLHEGLAEELSGPLAALGPALWILDGAELVVEPLARAVALWRTAAPELRLLLTSRQPLELDGEHRIEVGPLEPDAAIALLEDRARERGALVQPSERALQIEVVNALDRLPLAIELAAAPLDLLSLAEVRDQLRTGVLDLRDPSRSERAGPLAAALDGSVARLGASEREAHVRLAAFEAPFTPSDAAAVLRLDHPEAVARLHTLRSRSLLHAWKTPDGSTRLGQYAAVREHARRLLDSLPEREDVLEAHARWILGLCERIADEAALGLAPTSLLAERLPELRAIADRFRSGRPELAAQAGLAMATTLQMRGPRPRWREVVRQLEALQPSVDAAVAIRIDIARATCHREDLGQAGPLLEDAIARAVALRRPDLAAGARSALAFALRARDPDRAIALLTAAIEDTDDEARTCQLQKTLCQILVHRSDPRAEALLDRTIEAATELGAAFVAAALLGSKADFLRRQCRPAAQVVPLLRRAIEQTEALGFLASATSHTATLVDVLLNYGLYEEADAEIARLDELSQRTGHADQQAFVPIFRGVRALLGGDLVAARRFLQLGWVAFDELGDDLTCQELDFYLAWVELYRGDPATAEFHLRRTPARPPLKNEAALLALALHRQGRFDEARAALDEAATRPGIRVYRWFVEGVAARLAGEDPTERLSRPVQDSGEWLPPPTHNRAVRLLLGLGP